MEIFLEIISLNNKKQRGAGLLPLPTGGDSTALFSRQLSVYTILEIASSNGGKMREREREKRKRETRVLD